MPVKPGSICVLILAAFALLPGRVSPQTNVPGAPAPPRPSVPGAETAFPAFDVVSIRPSKLHTGLDFGATSDGFQARDTPLFWVILQAFYPNPTAYWRKSLLQAAPPWVFSESYDINAKFDDATGLRFQQLSEFEKERALKMPLQKLLVERCHITLHNSTVQGSFLALELKRKPAGLLPSSGSETSPQKGIEIGDGGSMKPVQTDRGRALEFRRTSMASLAEVLSGLTTLDDYTVIDRTGLPGTFDFTLYKREMDATDRAQADADSVPQGLSRWNIEALGLALRRSRGSLPNLVIEHIDPPGAN